MLHRNYKYKRETNRQISSLLLVLVYQTSAFAQIGPQLTAAGPINLSMGGASTAAPLDTLGAFLWNPATITALPSSTDFGLEVLLPAARLDSTVNAGSLAPGFPPVMLSGSDHSNSGAFPVPQFGAHDLEPPANPNVFRPPVIERS